MRGVLVRLTACLTLLLLTSPADAAFFTVPTDGQLYFRPMGGEAGAATEFGIARSTTDLTPLFFGLPNNPNPNTEVLAPGIFSAGQMVDFYMRSTFGGTNTVFSFNTDRPSLIAFTDTDNSLRMGGSVIQQTSPTTWLLRLDDALSFNFDDDDNDVLIQIRLDPSVSSVPEPTSLALAGTGALLLVGSAWRRWKRGDKKADQHS